MSYPYLWCNYQKLGRKTNYYIILYKKIRIKKNKRIPIVITSSQQLYIIITRSYKLYNLNYFIITNKHTHTHTLPLIIRCCCYLQHHQRCQRNKYNVQTSLSSFCFIKLSYFFYFLLFHSIVWVLLNFFFFFFFSDFFCCL